MEDAGGKSAAQQRIRSESRWNLNLHGFLKRPHLRFQGVELEGGRGAEKVEEGGSMRRRRRLTLASFSCWRWCSSASNVGGAPPAAAGSGRGEGGEPPNEGRSSAAAAAPPPAADGATGLLEGEGRLGREEEQMGQSCTRTWAKGQGGEE
jgi:hypothetical protein